MRRKQRRALENIERSAEEISSQRATRIAELGVKAAGVGLKPLAGVDFVWIPEKDEVPGASLPTTFFTLLGEQDNFVKHELVFPIRDLGELAIAVAAVDVLYSRIENAIVYERYGISGLVEFLQDSSSQELSTD